VDIDDAYIGQRVQEIRTWRGMTVTATAGLAGISQSYLSMIEKGDRPVTKRALLEGLAHALKVSPGEFVGKPWERGANTMEAQAHAGLIAVTAALDAYELGVDHGEPMREWPEVAADVQRAADLTHIHADYVGQVELIPRLLGDLHALYVHRPQLRREILVGLILCYKSALTMTSRLGGGGNGYSLTAAVLAQRCAEELDSPRWRAITTWYRGLAAGSLNRAGQYRRAVRMAEELSPELDDPEAVQAYGMLHLSAAMAAAAQTDRDTATTHLDEAAKVANRLDPEVGTFAWVWFGRTNVGIWRVAVGVELGDGPKVAEVARNVEVRAMPSPCRQANFYAELGRSLLPRKRTRDKGVALLLRAESLAPQFVRGDVFVREAVADQLRMVRRDAGGRELRGLAYRMGITPIG
jgi:transcriptional regulator with XRE-family HTH domain